MAHKKAGGSSRNGRDSNSKRLGVKAFGGQEVGPGALLIKYLSGVGRAIYHTLFSKILGKVSFIKKGPKLRQFVNVEPL